VPLGPVADVSPRAIRDRDARATSADGRQKSVRMATTLLIIDVQRALAFEIAFGEKP
jgi:hypothetical protein